MTDTAAASSDLPLDRLEAWLRGHVEGFRGPLAAERFAGGQSNPSYRLDAASGQYVLRRKPSGPAAAERACGRSRVPRHAGARRHAGAGAARPRAVRGRCGDRQRLLCDGISRRPHLLGPAPAGDRQPGRARRDVRLDERGHRRAAHGRLRGGRARRFRPSRQLHGPPDRALEPAVPRLRDRDDRGDGPADRLAAAAHPARERAGDRPRRLPHGQSGLSQDRAAS